MDTDIPDKKGYRTSGLFGAVYSSILNCFKNVNKYYFNAMSKKSLAFFTSRAKTSSLHLNSIAEKSL